MTLHSQLEHWLDRHCLDDALLAEAYESVGGPGRALLKKNIAWLHQIWGESPERNTTLRRWRQGFLLETEDVPCPYALIVCDASCVSPAAFLAVLMPAVLAGVELIAPCFIFSEEHRDSPTDRGGGTGGFLPAPGLLAALELTGTERAFAADENAAAAFLHLAREVYGNGRLVVIGKPSFGLPLLMQAHESGLICRSLTLPPAHHSSQPRETAGQWIHEAGGPPDKTDDMAQTASNTRLNLDVKLEDFPIWPDLEPIWFRCRRMRLSAG